MRRKIIRHRDGLSVRQTIKKSHHSGWPLGRAVFQTVQSERLSFRLAIGKGYHSDWPLRKAFRMINRKMAVMQTDPWWRLSFRKINGKRAVIHTDHGESLSFRSTIRKINHSDRPLGNAIMQSDQLTIGMCSRQRASQAPSYCRENMARIDTVVLVEGMSSRQSMRAL